MTEQVTLTITNGRLEGHEYGLDEPRQYLIGRGEDCDLRLPREPGPLDISRHHCLLELGPDGVTVADLGSLHGTYVNGELIGQRPAGILAEQASADASRKHALHDGDELVVGNLFLRVGVHALQPA